MSLQHSNLKNNNVIIFYELKGCHFCDLSKDLLKPQIEQGLIVVKDSAEAPDDVKGYPTFVNPKNGKIHTGKPKNFQHLSEALEMNTKEHYAPKSMPMSYSSGIHYYPGVF
tara:strand:- start:2049 stop:2381 length:333 start_codon:yes stop_codon:yes gene_type:complete